jgi:uncharacterized protein (TIGR02145 family)
VTISIPAQTAYDEDYSETWMAENLNYIAAENSFCYDDKTANCAKYGRLYTWAAAMGKTESECGYGKRCGYALKDTVKGVCPDGWHLPSYMEWDDLIYAAGYSTLKAESWNGTDDYKFSVLPGGRFTLGGFAADEGDDAFFWTSTEDGIYDADHVAFVNNSGLEYVDKGYGYSVRCIKNKQD